MKTEELFIEYMDNLYRIAVFMLSNVQDAEDAVQETYVRYLLKKPKLNNQEHEKAWLMRVCINICKNQIRYRNRHPKYNIEEVDVIGIELEEKEILREISLLPVKLKRKLSGSLLACSSQSDNLQHFVNSLIWQSQNDCPKEAAVQLMLRYDLNRCASMYDRQIQYFQKSASKYL